MRVAARAAAHHARPDLLTGYVGILSFELFLPGSQSLKEKRMAVRSVKQHLANRLGCSVAEVDHHDVWQRARLTLACVTRESVEAERLLDEAERWLAGSGYEVIAAERGMVTLDDC
ncbi:MAG: DUF503 domain-containing protein [Actinobacteria bacterium]|nr:DUF503 domain-containing protein [Actinomycetota bacterium]